MGRSCDGQSSGNDNAHRKYHDAAFSSTAAASDSARAAISASDSVSCGGITATSTVLACGSGRLRNSSIKLFLCCEFLFEPAQLLVNPCGLVGQHQPGHQQHPAFGHPANLVAQNRRLGIQHGCGGFQEMLFPDWQATSNSRPPMETLTSGIGAPFQQRLQFAQNRIKFRPVRIAGRAQALQVLSSLPC